MVEGAIPPVGEREGGGGGSGRWENKEEEGFRI